tara:strand:- start:463 stop:888 length:426 start_codon:yes stop_codon:yes gene_type:complete
MRTETHKNCLFLAWLIALVSTLGALFIGEIMERTPCDLCWYQRIAMFPLALILGIASFSPDVAVRRYVLPIAATGAVIAFWHSLLFAGIIPEAVQPCTREGPSCTGDKQTLFGVLPLPFLAAAGFTEIILLLTIPFRKSST